jgi:hypothetical protein
MEASKRAQLPIVGESRAIDDRRAPDGVRIKTLKGAQIIWVTGVPVKCIVRNLSQTGAKIEIHDPVPEIFELVFDGDDNHHPCRVVWRKEFLIGVQFT